MTQPSFRHHSSRGDAHMHMISENEGRRNILWPPSALAKHIVVSRCAAADRFDVVSEQAIVREYRW